MAEELISRPYQAHLEEISAKKNTIIHLPTGSGKTFIAICVIKRFRGDLQKPWGQGGKRTFFLVNTVPLVSQQKKVIETLCPVNGVGSYSGEDGVDYWDKDKWDYELDSNQVCVMTSQILLEMLAHSYIFLKDINLIIFDECHHAVDDHPMRCIMKYFEDCPVQEQPRVLGLTSTLLNSNVTLSQVEVTLKDLETTFHATIATVNELGEVLTYSTNPTEFVQYYASSHPTDASQEAIAELVNLQSLVMAVRLPKARTDHDLSLTRFQLDISTDPKKIVKAVKNMVVAMVSGIEELGVYGGALGIQAHIILLERLKRKATTKEEELLYKITITHATAARIILMQAMEKDTGYRKILKHSSPKFIQILNILKEYNPNEFSKPGVLLKVNHSRKPLSAIIFTQQRFTAKILYNLLKEVKEVNPEEFGFLKHDFIVGFNINPMKCSREQHYHKKTSQKALLMFTKGELNCLISTNVIEEGVDIPQCLLVLRYDPPLEYRSYIQSKGRARSKDASYVIMVKSVNQTKFEKNFKDFQRIEQYIQRLGLQNQRIGQDECVQLLVGTTDDRDAPSQDMIQGDLYDEDEIPPYVTPQGGRLSSVLAISLINRYFSMLPHDQFTVITPAWVAERVAVHGPRTTERKQQVTIIMPISCPVKDAIKGHPQANLKSAKRSAALNACVKLHQNGQLDAVTLLPLKYAKVDFDDKEIRQCLPNWPWDGRPDEEIEEAPKPGSKKNMRVHRLQFPNCLKAASGSATYYLHIIKTKTAFPEPQDRREKTLYNFLQVEDGFGFLTQQPLAKLCAFPTFLTIGEVTTEIEMNYAVIQLNENLFSLVKRFHLFIFEQVLSIAKKFLVFEGVEGCLWCVPVSGSTTEGHDIDWKTIQEHHTIPAVAVPQFQERKSLKVTDESYRNCVVTPWYRGVLMPDRYIVSHVLEYMTPKSPFGSDCFLSYADYYSSKYNLDILGPLDQPLLEVRNITSGMNCLLPRAVTIRAFSDKQKRQITTCQGDDKYRSFTEYFIPEFCIKYDFPGMLWYKAMMLPSIIHRLHMLFVAQELMMEIASEIKYGCGILPKTQEWLPIVVDDRIVMKSLLSNIEETNKPQSLAVDRINQPVSGEEPAMPKISSMKNSLYQLQKKKINKEYPWDERQEPLDIERNISETMVMDIEVYDEFVSAAMATKPDGSLLSPQRYVPVTTAAIKPAPPKYVEEIEIFKKKPKGRGPELRDVLAALTTINSSDGFDLERTETLGDSFLKFAATLYLYHKFPQRNEGQLTNIKSRLISNRNLYYAAERINLGGRMKVEPFTPRKDFLVPGFFAPKQIEQFIRSKKIRPTFLIGTQFSTEEVMSGELYPESWEQLQRRLTEGDGIAEYEPPGEAQNAMQGYLHSQAVSDKSVADCVEALIGTYLLSGGILAAVKIVEWLKIIPAQDKLATLLTKTVPTVISEGKATKRDIDFLLDGFQPSVEKALGYNFKDSSLLLEALSHPSFIRNRLTRSYERLEFLGDAVLDFLITAHIYENNPNLTPEDLTDLRSALVNNVTFAAYVVKHELHKYMCKDLNPSLDKAIMEFVEHQKQRNHEVVEEVLYLIDEEECHIAEYVEVPKALSDIFESLIGAIYLDCGGNLQSVWSVVYPLMCNEINSFSARIPKQPVKVLHEMIHACPSFGSITIVDPDIPKVMIPVTFTKGGGLHTVYGVGRNKAQAKRAAAKLALKVIADL